MSFKTLIGLLLAESDWREVIGPLVVFGIYAVASILKKVAGAGKTDSAADEDETEQQAVASPPQTAASAERPPYKPLSQVAKPVAPTQSPRQRTLPYARTQQVPPQQQAELQHQQRLQQLRDEQIQMARRRQAAQQQQAAAQRAAAAKTAAYAGARLQTPQEKLRQAPVPPTPPKPRPTAASPVAAPPHPPVPSSAAGTVSPRRHLRNRRSLRSAIVLKEILDKPLALR